jgi:membrane dipeptidase
VKRLDSIRTLVDLAHIGRSSFFDAVRAHDPSLPFVVTHTGVDVVHPHWRNLTDAQIRAVADSGGTVGIMLQQSFLTSGRATVKTFVDHVAHVVRVVGDDHVSLGSDFDGMIIPPADVATPFDYPRIVQEMLDRGMKDETIRKFLGANFLRVVGAIRG